VGRQKEFEVALQSLRGNDADISREAAEIEVGIHDSKQLNLFGIERKGDVELIYPDRNT